MDKSGLEIERKFLIEKYSGKIEGETRWDIIQTYLARITPDIQRRVRMVTENGEKISYWYTEKKFISDGVREENEKQISANEYFLLRDEADRALADVIKTRRRFEYKSHIFEMDEYPFSDKYASVETELSDINEKLVLPYFLTVIKEITNDERYSNANLALIRKFPEEIKDRL